MQQITPQATYQQQIEIYSATLAQHVRQQKRLGWLRLALFILTAVVAYKIFTGYGLVGFAPIVVGTICLLYVVSRDVLNNAAIKNLQTLLQINREELQVLDHQYTDRYDGANLNQQEHDYANDLDILGKSSVFQLVSRCYTQQGQEAFAYNLLHPRPVSLVLLRQQAVKELAPLVPWRQQWQAYAMQPTVTTATQTKITAWATEEDIHFTHPAWPVAINLYSAITIASSVGYLFDFISGQLFTTLFLVYFIVSLLLSRKTIASYNKLDGIVKEIASLRSLVNWFEKASFQSIHLKNVQSQLAAETTAGKEIKTLQNILERFDIRHNVLVFLIFNSFVLWDARQAMALNAWRKKNRAHLADWFAAVAEVEVVHSLATLHLNQPHWCFPTFTDKRFTINAKEVGHPLLARQQSITNDFVLTGTPKLALITGSNMAGKSTFLRSMGVNCILAQMGAPVCAAAFSLSPVHIVSSMRIADNLAENTSTFYAELKKLRTIIEKVKNKENVFLLLDEILRGTNSFDRHKGSAALVKQLIKEEAVAVLATHDVELAQMQAAYPEAINNYHFDVEVEGEELYFDYKLKGGVCRSLNASILMKKIGIEIQE